MNNNTEFYQEKLNEYLTKIDLIAKESFNNEQKSIAKKIILSAHPDELDSIYNFVIQRVKTGFVFDSAPEVNHNCVALISEKLDMSINLKLFGAQEHNLIIGENYDALKNILVAYTNPNTGKGLIDMIYIDPPYSTEKAKKDGNDYKKEVKSSKFIYRDKFTRDGWLNMMNERLKLARKLLSDDGLIFVSINDSQQAYLKILMDEIFDEENFLITFHWVNTSTPPSLSNVVRKKMEYVIMYKKMNLNQKLSAGFKSGGDAPLLNDVNSISTLTIPKEALKLKIPDGTYRGQCGRLDILEDFKVENQKAISDLVASGRWKWTNGNLFEEINNGTKIWIKSLSFAPRYEKESERNILPSNIISKVENNVGTNENAKKELESIFGYSNVFPYPKPTSLIKYLLKLKDNKNAVVLDFFAGSGSTGQAVMELNYEDGGNRKFILVTNNENNIATKVTLERLFRIIKGHGTKNQKFNWRYSDDHPYLSENSIRVFDIDYHELFLHDFGKAREISIKAKKEFVKLNPNMSVSSDINIYNALSALNPYDGEH